jgi:hypothetical protein
MIELKSNSTSFTAASGYFSPSSGDLSLIIAVSRLVKDWG